MLSGSGTGTKAGTVSGAGTGTKTGTKIKTGMLHQKQTLGTVALHCATGTCLPVYLVRNKIKFRIFFSTTVSAFLSL
jgi:hypothetical protein